MYILSKILLKFVGGGHGPSHINRDYNYKVSINFNVKPLKLQKVWCLDLS